MSDAYGIFQMNTVQPWNPTPEEAAQALEDLDRIEYDEDNDLCSDPDCLTCASRRAMFEDPFVNEEEVAVKQTLVILKPDCLRRKIVSKVYKRLEATDLTCVFMELRNLTFDEAVALYNEHAGEDFYGDLLDFMKSGPSIVMVWEGDRAAHVVRDLIGNKHPSDSPAGTIRGDLGGEYPETIIHGSDPWSAKREVKIFYECS